MIGLPVPISVCSRVLNRSIVIAGARKCSVRTLTGGAPWRPLGHEQRQEEGVEDRAGAVAERVELDLALERPRACRRIPRRGAARRRSPAAFSALCLHLLPD